MLLNTNAPVSPNETARLLELSKLDLDYSSIEDNFKDLAQLAAKITGAPVSLINLVDSLTQWSIAKQGTDMQFMPREDSVCQYTIIGGDDYVEVKDLTADDRFKDKFYVARPDGFKYYLGVPLRSANGNNFGALCILNTVTEELSAEKIELLKLIAGEVVTRLEYLRKDHELLTNLTIQKAAHKMLAGNINEPLAGIAGILRVIIDHADELSMDEVLEYVKLMQKSSEAIFKLTNAALRTDEENLPNEGYGDLIWLKEAIEQLYGPMCRQNNIELNISTSDRTEKITFAKNKILPIAGNLVAYAIKHTPATSIIDVNLALKVEADSHVLSFNVRCPYINDKYSNYSKQALKLLQILVNDIDGHLDSYKTDNAQTCMQVSIKQNKV